MQERQVMYPFKRTRLDMVIRKHTIRNLPLGWKIARIAMIPFSMLIANAFTLVNLYLVYLLANAI